MAKKKIKKNVRRILSGFLSDDNRLSRKELRKISEKATKKGFAGSDKKLAKIIKKQAGKVNPKLKRKIYQQPAKVDVKKNTRRLQTLTPLLGPLRNPSNNKESAPFPVPTGPIKGQPVSNPFDMLTQSTGGEYVRPGPKVREAPNTQVFYTPEPSAPPPPGEAPPKAEVGQKLTFDQPPADFTPQPNFKDLLDELVAQRNQPAPVVNVETPEPKEALGRAKSTSSYLSGGSAGGIRRRRSNRSKLGLSGLGTNQLNRNVSNLLSIRGISI